MKSSHSYRNRRHIIAGIVAGVLLLTFSATSIWANRRNKATASEGTKHIKRTMPPKVTKKPAPAASPASPPPAPTNIKHTGIVTSIFWVGEGANDDNGYISNAQSAWDEQWQAHYGGVDSSKSRNGYLPAGFTPLENPFYFALPYSDYTDVGVRKSSASNCPNYVNRATLAHHSWCKNSWITISYGGKTAYAQWEDVGPYEEDDVSYVFGTAAPKNKIDLAAGLDVSPAVRDYLGLSGESKTDWVFVSATNVPAGPWKNIITTSKGVEN
ncbi:MAG TPA: hypothetical protein VJC09_00095 [Candidatus Saccharimonadales bacterium]|nr:hypothetical protein [Candidatus Saccharimonadales bacterium]